MKSETLTAQQMAEHGTPAPAPAPASADPRVHRPHESARRSPPQPHSLRDALRDAAGRSSSSTSVSTSEEDYDDKTSTSVEPVAVLLHTKKDDVGSSSRPGGSSLKAATMDSGQTTPSDSSFDATVQDVAVLKGAKVYTIASDDKELRDILKKGLQRAKDSTSSNKRKGKFRDYVFTKKFSTFDMRNEVAATSPFQGFFTLFWMAVAFCMLKIGADNWRQAGSPLGTNDLMRYMFKRDVVVLLVSDGVMCGLTGVSWALQVLVFKGWMDWDGAGWILQHIWQTLFIGGSIGWTLFRDWPWSHTVFLVLHTLIMLMKQHSYAFYNGYLSTAYKKREDLLKKLKQLEQIEPAESSTPNHSTTSGASPEYLNRQPSMNELKQRRRSLHSGTEAFSKDLEGIEAAIESNKPLDREQLHLFEKIITWEVDGLTEELQGKATTPERAYPNNLTFKNHYEYIPLPTVVYELEYPRSDSINWRYVAEKLAATFGVIFVMIMVSQAFIYPVVMKTVAMKEAGMPLVDRFKEFPWLLSDLVFPFMLEYIMAWYLIWEAILNVLGEVTYFADREFYGAWWNSVSWDQFARDWNRPVHNFLLRHVYHSSISAMRIKKHTATLITFLLSACVHELVMWCIFKKLRGYLLGLQMFQLPLIRLSRTKWLRGRQTLGNIICWFGIFTGPSILCSLYLIL